VGVRVRARGGVFRIRGCTANISISISGESEKTNGLSTLKPVCQLIFDTEQQLLSTKHRSRA
jgi:hypothetical protein